MFINLFDSKLNKVSELSSSSNVNSVSEGIQIDESIFANESSACTVENSELANLSSDDEQLLIMTLQQEVLELESQLEDAKKSNGWISSAWDFIKNVTGLGAGSNKAQDKIDELKNQIATLSDNPNQIYDVYKNITGRELTEDDFLKINNGEMSILETTEASMSVEGYKEGQKMCVDVVADIASGIAAVGAVALGTTIGICAAPFTAGASLGLVAAGIGIAAGVGAATKVAIKASDCLFTEKEYSLQNLGYDLITGSINGAMGPVSNALGGAAGTAVMKAAGMRALETTVVNSAVKQGAVKVAATAVDMVVDGTLSGATDGFSRAVGEGRYEDILDETLTSAAGGAIASPIIGGSFKLIGSAGSALGKKIIGEVSDSTAQVLQNTASDSLSDVLSEAADYTIAHDASATLTSVLGDSDIDFITSKLGPTNLTSALSADEFARTSSLINSNNVMTLKQDGLISTLDIENWVRDLNNSQFTVLSQLLDDDNIASLVTDSKIDLNQLLNISKNIDVSKVSQLKDLLISGDFASNIGDTLKMYLSDEQYDAIKLLLGNDDMLKFLVDKGDLTNYEFVRNIADNLGSNKLKKIAQILDTETAIDFFYNEGYENFKEFMSSSFISQCDESQLDIIHRIFSSKGSVDLEICESDIDFWLFSTPKENMPRLLDLIDSGRYGQDLSETLSVELAADEFSKIQDLLDMPLIKDKNVISLSNLRRISNNLSYDGVQNLRSLLSQPKISGLKRSDFYVIPQSLDLFLNYSDENFSKLLNNDNIFNCLNNGIIYYLTRLDLAWLVKQANMGSEHVDNLCKLFDNPTLYDAILTNKNSFNFLALEPCAQYIDSSNFGLLLNKIEDGVRCSQFEAFVYLYGMDKINLYELDFRTKTTILSKLSELRSKVVLNAGDGANTNFGNLFDEKIITAKEFARLEECISSISQSMKKTITTTEVSPENIKRMMTGFFANNNAELENVLKNFDFSVFGKDGLPLSYSRAEFLDDMDEILANLSQDERNRIFSLLEITPVMQDSKIAGYNGILNPESLDLDNEAQQRVYQIVNKFLKENSVITSDARLNNALNALIEGMPEFLNIVGKQQHKTQALSVDAHILKVLQGALSNPNYASLSDLDKTCLKFSTILHDIAKSEAIVDDIHPLASALYSRNIMSKYTFNDDINDRIFELVKNHHWLADYNNNVKTPEYIAGLFRHKDDYLIAKIIAEADLMGVSDEFYTRYASALDATKQLPLEQAIANMNSTGQLSFTSRVVKPDLLPQVAYNGNTYRVLDITNLADDADLGEFGFVPGTKKQDMRIYAHMVSDAGSMETVDLLSDVANGGFLCASLLSPDNLNTYGGRKYGLSIQAENVNIANAANSNQGSGYGKGFDNFINIISGNSSISAHRKNIPNSIKDSLGLSDEQYARLYEQIASKKYISQITDDSVYIVDDIQISGSDLRRAINDAQDGLFNLTWHNETNIYNPKIDAFIAKVDSIEEIPDDFLRFVREHDLPIYLMGAT